MSRPLNFTSLPFASVLIVWFTIGSNGLGQGPIGSAQKGAPAPASELDRFRALDPAERLRVVEALPGAKDAFRATTHGDLTATILERGSLDAANAADLYCKVPARKKDAPATTIKWVVDDGTVVKKGDRLVELDDAVIRDEIAAAKVRAGKAAAAASAAADDAERGKRADARLIRLAEIDVELAEIDLKQPLAGQNKRALELKVEQAKLRLEQTKEEATGRQARANAEQRERATKAKVEADRLRSLEAELNLCVLTAPIDGIAVYHVPLSSRFGSSAAIIAQGEPVREGQKLIRVANLDRMVAGTRVHEAQISKVQVGQSVRVRVDAYPNLVLRGKVAQVSPVAAADDWARSDVKRYPVTVALEESQVVLKPTMSAEVWIETGERKGVLLVRTRSIVGTGRAHFCFVKTGDKVVEQEVTTGVTDGTNVEVTAGLREYDMVLDDPSSVLSARQPRK
jgi:HlyD family secretion protein